MEKEIKSKKKKNSGITLIALVVTIIVLIILAGVSINLVLGNNGIITRAREARNNYQKAAEEEEASLALLENEIDKYIPKNDDSKVSEEITYTENGETKTLTKSTAVGTKIGTTENIDGQTLDWYLFDVSDDGKTAYLVSTPTYWVPDTTKPAVSGAWVPKLVSSADSRNTGAIRQAIQKEANGKYWSSYTYNQSSVTYTPKANTLSYYKSANSQWSDKRGSTAFASLNENEQEAYYVADADIFAGIKDQVNKAEGNLKGKIQTLVGGASAEQWCKAYNKQTIVKEQQPNGGITCAYQSTYNPGYIYKVNGTAQNSGWWTNTNTIFGNDIYGAARNNGDSLNPFYSDWLLASPSSYHSTIVCIVAGAGSILSGSNSHDSSNRFSLFASVAL